MINYDSLIQRIKAVVDKHYLGDGAYARYLWQSKENNRKMGINEYGCADAMNILYSINALPRGAERDACVKALQSLQHEDTGLFEEHTHHFIHTTAHCVAALELFDADPLYPPVEMMKYFTKEGMTALYNSIRWETAPWRDSHEVAGTYVVGVLTNNVDIDWQNHYFGLLFDNTDPDFGMSRAGYIDEGKIGLNHHLNGWFHYMFNMEYAKRPLKYPEKLIDTCIEMYDTGKLGAGFGHGIGFSEIDWVFALNRAMRQSPHRFEEAKARIREFGYKYIEFIESLDFDTNEGINDLHCLFGAVCCLAELQTALPGEIVSTRPMRLVLDRRPFI